jgi:ABC-2 type transport system ATP-binding protein
MMIQATGISKAFGDVEALTGVDLEVETGTMFGLLGPNSAGKTTIVRILTTLLAPDAGHATVAGYDVVTERGPLRSAIGLAGQYAAVDEILTGRENFVMSVSYIGCRRERHRTAPTRSSISSTCKMRQAGR